MALLLLSTPETLLIFFQEALEDMEKHGGWWPASELKHITGQTLPATTIVREYPEDFGPGKEPYYPVPCPHSKEIYSRYAQLAAAEERTCFVGRLARYRYYNMDQVVAMALKQFRKIAGAEGGG